MPKRLIFRFPGYSAAMHIITVIAVIGFMAGGGLTLPAQSRSSFLRKDFHVSERLFDFQYTGRVFAADVNGDGRPDLIISSAGGFSVRLNEGGGNFARAIHDRFGTPAPLVAADFNDDGKLDLAGLGCCTPSGTPNGRILIGRGDGTFLEPVHSGGAWLAATAGDFNGDGKADLATTNLGLCGGQPSCSASVTILLGQGNGTFRPGMSLPQHSWQPVVADFNRDGKADLALAWERTLSVLLGRGDGTFLPAVSTEMRLEFRRAEAFLAADINKDGLPDIVTAFDILPGKGDGSFGPAAPLFDSLDRPDSFGPRAPVAAVDFDADGRVDVLTRSDAFLPITSSFLIFSGKGDGATLPRIEEHPAGWHPFSVAVADFDGDGRPDVATANLYSSTMSVLFGRPSLTLDPAVLAAVNPALSAANDAAVVAPESLAVLYVGAGTEICCALVVLDSAGVRHEARLLDVAEKRISFVVPKGSAPGLATLLLVGPNWSTPVGVAHIADIAPGLFMASHPDRIAAATSMRVNQDGSQTVEPAFGCVNGSCARHALVGPHLTLYGTGFKNVTAADVTCSINGYDCTVLYAGPQGTPGLDQINVRLPLDSSDLSDWRYGDLVLSIRGILLNVPYIAFW